MRSSVRTWRWASVLGLAATATVGPLAGGAQATEVSQAVPQGIVQTLTFADKCLDVAGGSTADSTPIIQYTCDSGARNQRFEFRQVSAERYQIRTFANKCLDVAGGSTSDSARIIQYTCTPGSPNQEFRVDELGDGRVAIRTFANKCLDAAGASTADSVPIIQYTCGVSANQKFWIV